MKGVLNVPQVLWHKTIWVRDREKFLAALNNGYILEYKEINHCSRNENLLFPFQGWRQIKFGLNCILR